MRVQGDVVDRLVDPEHRSQDDGVNRGPAHALALTLLGALIVVLLQIPQQPATVSGQTNTETPTDTPTDTPSGTPSDTPTDTPTGTPSDTPTDTPPDTPSGTPSDTPTDTPAPETPTPSNTPTDTPGPETPTPSNTPTDTPGPNTATPTPSEAGGELCTDGMDNDADNQIDCADSGCQGEPACLRDAPMMSPFALLLVIGTLTLLAFLRLYRRLD